MRSPFLLAALLFGAGCPGETTDPNNGIQQPTGPELSWDEVDSLVDGQSLPLRVTATHPEGVVRVAAFFRTAGDQTWQTAPSMQREGDVWTTEIPARNLGPPALELYFRGESTDGLISYLPSQGVQGPFNIRISRAGRELPYFQDFDSLGEAGLPGADWRSESTLLRGYAWEPTTNHSFSGATSIFHRRIPSSIAGEVEDWLISPPMNLSGTEGAMVSWVERGTDVDLADHSLWISTGSPDPSQRQFVEVTALPAPVEGQWTRARAVDLSAYAGEPAVFLAWKYRTIGADAWWIDDVRVEPLGPDLHVTDVAWTHDPLRPGESGELLLTIDNYSRIAASNVTLTTVASEHVDFGEPVAVGSVPAESSVDVRVPLTVRPDSPDNVRVDLTLLLRDDVRTWTELRSMLVGEASIARIVYDLEPSRDGDPPQLIRMTLGTGDPDEPDFALPIENALRTSGTHTAELDITEFYEFLPPQPGPNRWWARIEAGPRGAVTSFDISYGGETYSSTDLGEFTGFAQAVYWLPERSDPVFAGQTTSPTPVQPGQSVTWRPTFRNNGASTSGRTVVSVDSDDPDITIFDGGPVLISETGFVRGGAFTPTFSFGVSEARTTSVPARFIATITDDFESYRVPIDVPIPYPVLNVSGVVIDDWEGDDDGRLDPNESARLEITLANIGGLATDGSVGCVLTQAGGDVDVEIGVNDGFYGVLSPGSTFTQRDFEVEVLGGSAGDQIDFLLTCTDRSNTYPVAFELVLGERPWIRMTALPDAIGDNIRGYRFDILQGYYRSDGVNLEMMLESAEPFGGLSGLFIDAWGNSPGGAYSFYNITVNGTTGSIRGYRTRFSPLGTILVNSIGDTRVRMIVPLSVMDLRVNQFNVGFGAGFCGGTAQFCDHYPDGWGAPYTGLTTARWTTLRW